MVRNVTAGRVTARHVTARHWRRDTGGATLAARHWRRACKGIVSCTDEPDAEEREAKASPASRVDFHYSSAAGPTTYRCHPPSPVNR